MLSLLLNYLRSDSLMKKLVCSIYVFLTFLTSAYSQDVKIISAFDTTKILIGDQIKFTITVDQPADLQIALPEFKDTLIKNIEILSGPLTDSIRNIKGLLRIRKEYLITSFDSGHYQIPPVYAELKNEQGLKRFYSDYTYLEVQRTPVTPADTTAQIFDILAPYKAPLTFGEILPWILLILLLSIILYFGIKFFKKFRNKDSGQKVVVIPDPAHIVAFHELERLRDEKLWQKGEVKQYYTRLTEILRQYLENRFMVYSLELTTAETLDALLYTGFRKDENFKRLKSVLAGADMVKFAKYNPEPTENESYFQDAWIFVSETKLTETSESDSELKNGKVEGKV
jgi:hypothetical protein